MSTISEAIANYVSNPRQIFSDAEDFLASEPATQNIPAIDSYEAVAQKSVPLGIPSFLILPAIFASCYAEPLCPTNSNNPTPLGDNDGDNFFDKKVCRAPNQEVGDCNDEDASIHPHADEQCDGQDNNCDGQIDEDLVNYYPDNDGDGYGDNTVAGICSLTWADGDFDDYSTNNEDCDDSASRVNPGESNFLKDCAGDDDASEESNGTFNRATTITCGDQFEAAVGSNSDVDTYRVNFSGINRISVSISSYDQSLTSDIYDSDQNSVSSSSWLSATAYIKAEPRTDLLSGDPSYGITVNCNPCDEDTTSYSECNDGNVWNYSECDTPIDIDNSVVDHTDCYNGDVWEYNDCNTRLQVNNTTSYSECVDDVAYNYNECGTVIGTNSLHTGYECYNGDVWAYNACGTFVETQDCHTSSYKTCFVDSCCASATYYNCQYQDYGGSYGYRSGIIAESDCYPYEEVYRICDTDETCTDGSTSCY